MPEGMWKSVGPIILCTSWPALKLHPNSKILCKKIKNPFGAKAVLEMQTISTAYKYALKGIFPF